MHLLSPVSGPPVDLNALPSQSDCSAAELSWSPPVASQQNGECHVCSFLQAFTYYCTGVILGYDVTLRASDGALYSFSTNTASFSASQLRCCSDYTYQVVARTSAGAGVPSQVLSFRTSAQFNGSAVKLLTLYLTSLYYRCL